MDASDDDVEAVEDVRGLVERAVLVDVDLDPGQDAERRELRVQRCDLVELGHEPLGAQAVRDGQAWRVIGDDEVFAADVDRGLGHLADRGAAIRRERVRVKVAAQRLAEGRRTLLQRLFLGECLEPAQVDGLLTAQALEDRALGDLADAAQAAQAAGRSEARDLVGTQLRQRGRRAAEGADAIRGLLHCLEQVGDPLQVGDRVA